MSIFQKYLLQKGRWWQKLIAKADGSIKCLQFTSKFLPLLGENAFVLLCNAMTALMFLMRTFARDKSTSSYWIYFLSIVPFIAGSQNAVVVDSYCMERGIQSGMGKGECSASLDNINDFKILLVPPRRLPSGRGGRHRGSGPPEALPNGETEVSLRKWVRPGRARNSW